MTLSAFAPYELSGGVGGFRGLPPGMECTPSMGMGALLV